MTPLAESCAALLAEAVPYPAFTASPNGRVEYVNRLLADYAGRPNWLLTGSSWKDLMAPEEIVPVKTVWCRAVARREPWERVVRLRSAAGEHRRHEIRASPVHAADGRVERYLAVCIDVEAGDLTRTALAEAGHRVREQEALLDTLINAAPTAFAFVDRDLRYVRVNQALADINGLPAEAHVGRTVHEIVPELWAARLEPIYREVLDLGRPVLGREIEDGARRWLASYYPVTVGGEVVGVGVIALDVAERRALEEQVRHGQKMEALGRLAGGVAHDFNNLLGVMLAYTQFVSEALPAGSAAHADVREVVRAVESARMLTRQLLAFSRHEAVELVPLDVDALIRGMERILRGLAGDGIVVHTNLRAGSDVRADRGQLEQVITNLAVNARDAMPAGGTLTIETEDVTLEHRLADALIGAPAGRYVRLSVADTGGGIDDELREHIFEPFFTTKGAGRGTGLGLATVYAIVERTGGDVRVDSTVGRGTRVEVYLPRSDRRRPAPEPRPATPRGSETVLIVEDEPRILAATQRMLESLGYTVIAEQRGVDALERCAEGERRIDLLLTDVVMPGVTGPEVARRARALRPDLPVLYMSGFSAGVTVEPLTLKPFTRHELAVRVRATLDGA